MKSQYKKFTLTRTLRTTAAYVSVMVLLVGVSLAASPFVRADTLQQQIDTLNAQNAQTQGNVNQLKVQASSYQDAIVRLQQQIASIQAAIAANQAKQAELQAQIDADQQKLEDQRKLLGDDLKAMYVGGNISTVEMLATSKNLSDFVDAETYRGAVQNKIQNTLVEIARLQNQLKDQQTQITQLLSAQKQQQNQLANDQAQQNQLLTMNESQQAAYDNQIKANQAEISKLQAQQVALNRALFGGGLHYGGTGSYPWADAPCPYGDGGGTSCGNYDWGYPGDPYDPAGWQYRNCTSFAFWRLAQVRGITLTAGSFPNVLDSGGKIGYSIPDFKNLGYRVDHDPAGATLAVEGAGPYGPGTYGHIMYIEAGSYVSQYNAAGDGRYSTADIPTGSGIWFVHIP